MDIKEWLQTEPRIQTFNAVGSTTAFTQIVGADPDRFAAILSSDGSANVAFAFGENAGVFNQFILTQQQGSLIITFGAVGSYVRLPIWGVNFVGTQKIIVTSLSYDPTKARIYRERLKRYISDPGAL